MRSIKVKLEETGATLDGEVLGFAGEKGAVQLEIDICGIAQEGVDSAVLRYRLPDGVTLEGETAALPETGPLLVTVPDWAMSERGRVQMQLTLMGEGKAVRSYVWDMRVLPSLNAGGTPPAPVRDWLDEMEERITQGAKGDPGAVFTPSVSSEGVLSWSNNGGLSNPESVSIRGPKGDTGATGAQGPQGETGAQGPQGDPGPQGSQGETGPQGEKGDTGAQDPQGETGPAGADGKSAYAYAVDGGYTGTQEAFAAKLAAEMPTALPNPSALTFSGAVTGSYDGSAPLEVEIPSGGGYGGSVSANIEKVFSWTADGTVQSNLDSLAIESNKLYLCELIVPSDNSLSSGSVGTPAVYVRIGTEGNTYTGSIVGSVIGQNKNINLTSKYTFFVDSVETHIVLDRTSNSQNVPNISKYTKDQVYIYSATSGTAILADTTVNIYKIG